MKLKLQQKYALTRNLLMRIEEEIEDIKEEWENEGYDTHELYHIIQRAVNVVYGQDRSYKDQQVKGGKT